MQPDFKHFIRICDNINRTITRIPHKAAVLAVNFSKERFIKRTGLMTVSIRGLKQKSEKARP